MKKIISILLVFALFLTYSNFVFADETTDTVIVLTSYDGSSPGATSGNIERDSSSIVKKNISVTSSNGAVISVDENKDGTYDYINNSNTSIKSNYRTSLLDYINYTSVKTPVFSFKYDIYIPDDANVDANRSFKPVITAMATGDTSSAKNPTNITIDYSAKEFSINETKAGFETSDSKTVSYEPETWVTVEFRAYRGNDGKLTCGAYVGDAQIFYGEGNEDYSSLFALNNFTFPQDANVSTYMDNIIISMMSENYKPTEIPEAPVEIPSRNITLFDGSLLKDNKGTAFDTIPVKPTTANISMYPVDGCEYEKQLQLRYSGACGTGVTNNTAGDNTYYVMNWSDITSNYYKNVSDYMTTDTPVLSYSYDICIPDENSDKWRRTQIFLSSVTDSSVNPTQIIIEYDGTKFYVNDFSGLNEVYSAPIPYTPDNWIKFDIRAYLTTENKINVAVYANDIQVYYGEGTADYTDGLCVYKLGLLSETATVDETNVTFDTLYDDIDISVLPAKYIPIPMLSLSLSEDDVNDKVEAKAEVNGSYASLCLVTAVYNGSVDDGSGSLEKLWIDTTVEDGILSNVITGTEYAQYIISGYTVKAFVFDSLTSAIPQIEHETISIGK